MAGDLSRLPLRFIDKISVDEAGCWIWQASTWLGYGKVWWNGSMRSAHRVVYEILIGPIPEGKEPDHICKVKACVNPHHLEMVTHSENLKRAGLRSTQTHCIHGHEYTPENTRIVKTKAGGTARQCRACHINRMRIVRATK